MADIKVQSEAELIDAVRHAREVKTPFALRAGGTKRDFGRPLAAADLVLDVSALRGIVTYEPEELILTAGPGTAIAEVTALLDAKGQRLGFDPPEWAGLFGAGGASTLGGVVSADACGPARVRHGGVRDHLLGIRAVNGFGESFKAGGRVVKNVTGFDIPKLVCGALGTLCVLTELTFRVFPKPPRAVTLAVRNVAPGEGFALLRRVWSSPLDATGLSYLSSGANFGELGTTGSGVALFRLDGAAQPLEEKCGWLRQLLQGHEVEIVDEGDGIFAKIGEGAVFAQSALDVWRIFVPPSNAAGVVESVGAPLWLADWAGGLLWMGLPPRDSVAVARLRAAVAHAGGRAILTRADALTRADLEVFPPETREHAQLTRAVKAAFDPLSLFNPGRMYPDI